MFHVSASADGCRPSLTALAGWLMGHHRSVSCPHCTSQSSICTIMRQCRWPADMPPRNALPRLAGLGTYVCRHAIDIHVICRTVSPLHACCDCMSTHMLLCWCMCLVCIAASSEQVQLSSSPPQHQFLRLVLLLQLLQSVCHLFFPPVHHLPTTDQLTFITPNWLCLPLSLNTI